MNTMQTHVYEGHSNYSQIINANDYNLIMSKQHLYISASDKYIAEVISEETSKGSVEIIELGCGPGRILTQMRAAAPQANFTAVEADKIFAEDAQKLVKDLNISVIINDAESYKHPVPVDIFFSQGFHHHVSKGIKTRNYLQNVFDQLRHGGIYILSDEFLPDYQSESQREMRAIIWYSHIIAHAISHGYDYLAQEEAKTLLDDIYEGRSSSFLKNNAQIDYVLSQAPAIDRLARERDVNSLFLAVEHFSEALERHHQLKAIGDATIDFSRHDYKICDHVFRDEISQSGFTIEKIKAFGPIAEIGAMIVYVLRK